VQASSQKQKDSQLASAAKYRKKRVASNLFFLHYLTSFARKSREAICTADNARRAKYEISRRHFVGQFI
jgi:hypothetical protein